MKKIMFVYVDALNSSFINNNIMPFLNNMAKESYYRELENVFGYSFAIQSSMLSGSYPENNDNWMPYFFSPQTSPLLFKTFGKIGSILCFDKIPMLRFLMIWQARRFFLKKGVHTNNISSTTISKLDIYPYYYMCDLPFYAELKKNLFEECGAILTYIGPPETKSTIYNPLIKHIQTHKDEKELIIAYDDRLDMLGHQFGPYSDNCKEYAKFLDAALANVYKKMTSLFGNEITFLVFSDHGQCNCVGSIDIISELRKLGLKIGHDYFCFVDATIALFWLANSTQEKELISKLNKFKIGKIINRDLKKKYHIDFCNRKYGDVIFALKPGFTFFPNSFSPQRPMKGLHGYLPEEKVQKALLVSNIDTANSFKHVKDFKEYCIKILS